jgi:hypothetical protein
LIVAAGGSIIIYECLNWSNFSNMTERVILTGGEKITSVEFSPLELSSKFIVGQRNGIVSVFEITEESVN